MSYSFKFGSDNPGNLTLKFGMNRTVVFSHILFTFNLIFTTSFFIYVSGQSSATHQDTLPDRSATNQPVYTTSRLVSGRPDIDGKLDDECWKHGTSTAVRKSVNFNEKDKTGLYRQD